MNWTLLPEYLSGKRGQEEEEKLLDACLSRLIAKENVLFTVIIFKQPIYVT